MFRKYLVPALAVAGVIFAVMTVVKGGKQTPPAEPVAEPSHAPFASYVAGAGIVEAKSENIAVGTIVPGVVKEIYVKVGDQVKKGGRLFQIDDRDLRADLIVKRAALDQAVARRHKMEQGTRPEEIPRPRRR